MAMYINREYFLNTSEYAPYYPEPKFLCYKPHLQEMIFPTATLIVTDLIERNSTECRFNYFIMKFYNIR